MRNKEKNHILSLDFIIEGTDIFAAVDLAAKIPEKAFVMKNPCREKHPGQPVQKTIAPQ